MIIIIKDFIILILFFCICVIFNKLNMFFVSFTPLFLILLVDALPSPNKLNDITVVFKNQLIFTLLILFLLPIIIFIFKFIFGYRKKQLNNKVMTNPEKMGDGIVSYIMTYIVPLSSLGVGQGNSKYFDSILIFLMIMILYVRYDLVYINPIISLFFNVFKVTLDKKDVYIMTKLSFANFKDRITDNNINSLYKISNSLYFFKSRN